jgi:hypothetical protein
VDCTCAATRHSLVKTRQRYRLYEAFIADAKFHPANYVKDPWGALLLTGNMTKMSAVLRIKAELALAEASKKLRSQHASVRTSPETRRFTDTATVVRKELDKLVGILADDASEKHWNVAARVAKCADYIAQIPSREVQEARIDMIAAHKVLQDVQEITF